MSFKSNSDNPPNAYPELLLGLTDPTSLYKLTQTKSPQILISNINYPQREVKTWLTGPI